jgi:hypothetical protein
MEGRREQNDGKRQDNGKRQLNISVLHHEKQQKQTTFQFLHH